MEVEDEYQKVYRFDNHGHTWAPPPDPNAKGKLAEMIVAGLFFLISVALIVKIIEGVFS